LELCHKILTEVGGPFNAALRCSYRSSATHKTVDPVHRMTCGPTTQECSTLAAPQHRAITRCHKKPRF
jgi:hypothetical protein